MLAPQPFFTVRGTPIALRNLLWVLEEMEEVEHITLLTLPFGEDLAFKKVELIRLDRIPLTKQPRPGFSLTKVAYDITLMEESFKLLRREKYNLVYAVEEAVFIALLARKIFSLPYVYDMDSSLPEQLASRKATSLLAPFASWLERKALKEALAVIAVCPVLYERAIKYNPSTFLLPDTLPNENFPDKEEIQRFRKERGWEGKLVFLYTGNFQPYQGVDMLVEAFRQVEGEKLLLALVGKGGEKFVGTDPRVRFYGEVPPERINLWLAAADVLVSPRLSGTNTPMKIYSYLAAGKPIIATSITSHTQVLGEQEALLVAPSSSSWSEAIRKIAEDEALRRKLSKGAAKLYAENFSWEKFKERVKNIFGYIFKKLQK